MKGTNHTQCERTSRWLRIIPRSVFKCIHGPDEKVESSKSLVYVQRSMWHPSFIVQIATSVHRSIATKLLRKLVFQYVFALENTMLLHLDSITLEIFPLNLFVPFCRFQTILLQSHWLPLDLPLNILVLPTTIPCSSTDTGITFNLQPLLPHSSLLLLRKLPLTQRNLRPRKPLPRIYTKSANPQPPPTLHTHQ